MGMNACAQRHVILMDFSVAQWHTYVHCGPHVYTAYIVLYK